MTRKKTALTVNEDFSDLFSEASTQSKSTPERVDPLNYAGLTVRQALETIARQMEATGMRERTISDYRHHVNHFAEITSIEILGEINSHSIYDWLASMDVNNQTKLTRLKCLKAFLGRCFNNGWLSTRFWADIKIKVDSPIKEGATERDIKLLLSMLDLSDFVQLRDATAILMLFQTGIRLSTISQLEERHVDIDAGILRIDGGLLKNHEQIHLPFDNALKRLLGALMRQNHVIRRESKAKNNFIFITSRGGPIATSHTHNNIQKRLHKYSKQYGIKNINPHALRRGFAKKLLNQGANIALISKALGHGDLEVTTRYLHLDKEEVTDRLRGYL
jgi:site-specific recombinase XerD